MARRTFPEGFKEKAIAYPAEHPELSMKRCAEDLGIGYSTLRRWLDEAAEEAQNAAPAEEPVAAEAVEAAPAEEITPAEVATVEEALADAAPVLEDVLDEMEAVTLDETEALPEEGAVVEDDLPTEETVVETDQPAEEADAAEADEEPSIAAEVEDDEPSVEAAPASEKDEIDDDPLFASIGSVMSGGAVPHDEDYAFRCKSHPSSYKDVQHMAGDVFVSVTAQIGNVIEGVTDGMSGVAERLNLYKKRHDLKKEQKLLKKEKEKRLKR